MAKDNSNKKELLLAKHKDIFTFTDQPERADFDVVSTGSIEVDKATGIGGFPFGRIVELYGAYSTGKSTLALHAIREAQKKGISCMYIDSEHALDPTWIESIGIDMSSFYIRQMSIAEEIMEFALEALTNGFGIVVIDSLADMVPRTEFEGDIGDAHYGLLARVLTQGFRKIDKVLIENNSLLICTNQLRDVIGGSQFGPKKKTTGGNAALHAASMRLEIKRIATLTDSAKEPIGVRSQVKVTKNKLAPPFKIGEYELYFDRGIDDTPLIIEKAVDLGVVKKSGAWFAYKDIKVQGRDSFIDAVRGETFEEIQTHVQNGGIEEVQDTEDNPFNES